MCEYTYILFVFSSVTGAEANFVVNTDVYTKEKNVSVSSSKSGPVVAKREVKKVSFTTYLLISNLKNLNYFCTGIDIFCYYFTTRCENK